MRHYAKKAFRKKLMDKIHTLINDMLDGDGDGALAPEGTFEAGVARISDNEICVRVKDQDGVCYFDLKLKEQL